MPPHKKHPPLLARRFFRWYCNIELRESIEGDLEERFEENLEKKGLLRAQFDYYLDVLRFMNRYTLRGKGLTSRPGIIQTMFQNLSHSYRFLKRHRAYSIINLTGLSLGMAAALLISFFVQKELSFDNFFDNSDRIVRVNNVYVDEQGNRFPLSNSSPVFAHEFPKSIPVYEKATRMRYAMRTRLDYEEQRFYEDQGYYADSVFFEVLSYRLLQGEPGKVLDEPNSIVLTEDMALKYFKTTRPIGEVLTLNGTSPLKVTGILAPIPETSHLQFDFLISFSTYQIPDGYRSDLNSWSWGGFFTYALTLPNTDLERLTASTNALIEEQIPGPGTRVTVDLQPLKDIYLGSSGYPDDVNSHIRSGNPFTVYALAVVALLILIICGFNYANLSSALALQRGKEMGIRKVLGANNRSIRLQLFTDSILISLAGLFIAYLLVNLAHFYLPQFTGSFQAFDLNQILFSIPIALLSSIGLAFLISLYPALLITKTKATAAIKSRLTSGKSSVTISRAMIVLQCCISLGLLSSAFVIREQLSFIQEQQLGIEKESLLTVQMLPEDMSNHFDALKHGLESNANIVQVTKNERRIGDPWPVGGILVNGQPPSESKPIVGSMVGFDYPETLGVNMKSGRFFSEEIPNDALNAIVINQAAADLLGLEDPLGKEVLYISTNGPRRIIGIIEDFNFSSLHQEISPMALVMPIVDLDYITIRITKGNLSEKVEAIQSVWNEVTSDLPLDLRFMDDHLAKLYETEKELGSLISIFTSLAVLLACLGLYGLISFNTRSRLKEISIRKIIGAKSWSLFRLLSQEYIILLLIGAVLAVPSSYYALAYWLNNFAYGIEIRPAYFFSAFFVFLALCIATISQQILKVLGQNPVKHLRED